MHYGNDTTTYTNNMISFIQGRKQMLKIKVEKMLSHSYQWTGLVLSVYPLKRQRRASHQQ